MTNKSPFSVKSRIVTGEEVSSSGIYSAETLSFFQPRSPTERVVYCDIHFSGKAKFTSKYDSPQYTTTTPRNNQTKVTVAQEEQTETEIHLTPSSAIVTPKTTSTDPSKIVESPKLVEKSVTDISTRKSKSPSKPASEYFNTVIKSHPQKQQTKEKEIPPPKTVYPQPTRRAGKNYTPKKSTPQKETPLYSGYRDVIIKRTKPPVNKPKPQTSDMSVNTEISGIESYKSSLIEKSNQPEVLEKPKETSAKHKSYIAESQNISNEQKNDPKTYNNKTKSKVTRGRKKSNNNGTNKISNSRTQENKQLIKLPKKNQNDGEQVPNAKDVYIPEEGHPKDMDRSENTNGKLNDKSFSSEEVTPSGYRNVGVNESESEAQEKKQVLDTDKLSNEEGLPMNESDERSVNSDSDEEGLPSLSNSYNSEECSPKRSSLENNGNDENISSSNSPQNEKYHEQKSDISQREEIIDQDLISNDAEESSFENPKEASIIDVDENDEDMSSYRQNEQNSLQKEQIEIIDESEIENTKSDSDSNDSDNSNSSQKQRKIESQTDVNVATKTNPKRKTSKVTQKQFADGDAISPSRNVFSGSSDDGIYNIEDFEYDSDSDTLGIWMTRNN